MFGETDVDAILASWEEWPQRQPPPPPPPPPQATTSLLGYDNFTASKAHMVSYRRMNV